MIHKILWFISVMLIKTVNSQKCFINSDIINSKILFTYKGCVYDITDYNHPAGSNTLKKTIGLPLEDFVNLPRYDFHLTSNSFKNDMKKMYVGVLKDNCNQPTEEPTEEPTEQETTQTPTRSTTQIITDFATTTSSNSYSCILSTILLVIISI